MKSFRGILPLPILVAALFFAPRSAAGQTLIINEIMAANDTTIADPDYGEFADWIEIHNPGSAAVDPGGLYLTDDLSDPLKWRIPEGLSIDAGGYAIFWADDRGSVRHTSFRLSADGEVVGLFDAAGSAIDAITFGAQRSDISYGRSPDGGSEMRFFDRPTPGAPNRDTGYIGITNPPAFSTPAGIYPPGTEVSLWTGMDGATIRYTLDGSPPSDVSAAYGSPIPVTGTVPIRAAVFKDGYLTGDIRTNTYLIGETGSLPIVSLSTDPANFFDDEIGIYVEGTNGIPGYCRSVPLNWNQDWERPVHVEFFELDGRVAFKLEAGVKIHGGCTRLYPQKSLALYARNEYGASRIDYPIFGNRPFASYNNLVLRSSAQDWWRTMFRDGMIQTLIEQGMDLETQAYRPSIVFLNGQYWGIHNLREKQNEHYFADRAGVEPELIEILEGDKIDLAGASDFYDAMMDYVVSADMSGPDVLEVLSTYMDVDAYVDYLIAEIYSANADWPGNNLKLWRVMGPESRWRWVIFDMDFGFGGNANGQYDDNTLALATDPNGADWPNPPWSTLLLRRLLQNPDFRGEFIQRFAAHMNTTFEPEHVLHVIDSLKATIAHEIPRHKDRWPKSISFTPTWEDGIDIMREFARQRPLYARSHFYQHFGLSGSALLTLTIDEPAGGHVLAHGVRLPGPVTEAVFFRDVPVKLRAVPSPGYRFVSWREASTAPTDTVSITLTGPTSLTAVFEPEGATAVAASGLPDSDRLGQNYPNPFATATNIPFELARPGPVTLIVTDIIGRHVSTPLDSHLAAGRHEIPFPSAQLPDGVYFYTLSTPETSLTRRMLLVH